MNEKEKGDIASKGTFSGVGWDVCEDLRDYAEVHKSKLKIDNQLFVPDPSRFDYNLSDRRAYKFSPKTCLNTSLVHFSSVGETVTCH